jgi:hypothetical protein
VLIGPLSLSETYTNPMAGKRRRNRATDKHHLETCRDIGFASYPKHPQEQTGAGVNGGLPGEGVAQWDRTTLTVKVERYEKGKGPMELHLRASACSPDPPNHAGGRYRFYGDDPSFYRMYQALPRAAKR